MFSTQRGFTSVYALIIMAILLIFIAGLLPSANAMLKMTIIEQDAEIAQAAAESGAKVLISELYNAEKNSTLPNWVGEANAKAIKANNNSTLYYLEQTIKDTGSLYQCTIVGKSNKTTRKVYLEIEHARKTNSDVVDLTDSRILAFSPNEIKSGAVTKDGNLFSYSNTGIRINLVNVDLNTDYITPNGKYQYGRLIPITGYGSTPLNYDITTKVVMNKLEKVDPNFFKGYKNLTPEFKKNSQYGYSSDKTTGKDIFTPKTNILLYTDPGVYELDGTLVLTGNILDVRYLKVVDPGGVILHIKGDLWVYDYARIGFFLQNATKSESQKAILLIVDGDVHLEYQSGVNFATIISYGKIEISNNVNVFGSMQAVNGIEVSQDFGDVTPVNLFYKGSGVRPFRDILQQINTPDFSKDTITFKVTKMKNIK